jgi:hypothetical protein
MQAQPSIASPSRFVRSLLLVIGLTVSGMVFLIIATDDTGDTGCGGG